MVNASCDTLVSVVQQKGMRVSNIADLGEIHALAGLSPYHLNLAESVAQNGECLASILAEQLEILQESFIKSLNEEIVASGITLNNRIHVYFSVDEQLVFEGEQEDAEVLCKLASGNSRLKQHFLELARLAILTTGIETVCKAYDALQGHTISDTTLFSCYHLCFKGTLSHFFTKNLN